MQEAPIFTSEIRGRSVFFYRLYMIVLITPIGFALTDSVSNPVIRIPLLIAWILSASFLASRVIRSEKWVIFGDHLDFYRDDHLVESIPIEDIVSIVKSGYEDYCMTLNLACGRSRSISSERISDFENVLGTLLEERKSQTYGGASRIVES